ncbi:MAG: ABC transporter permease [Chloroflexi bacterium]|nr:ABC transporter permease [Chloroflexota bacterium]
MASSSAIIQQLQRGQRRHHGLAYEAWRMLRRDRVAVGGACVVLIVATLVILAPIIAPYDPVAIIDSSNRLAPIGSPGHPLGTDFLGRDVLSRILWGGRVSLPTGIFPVLLAGLVGTSLGLTAGFFSVRLDNIIMRVLDVIFAFPSLLLAIAIVSALGPGLFNALLAITIVQIPQYARLVRSSVLSLKEQEYVIAARAMGASSLRTVLLHVLPNTLAPILVYGTLETGRTVIFAAGLSFLGLGVEPPTPEWGAMLAEGRSVLSLAPHIATVPGLAIFVVTLSLNLLGDGLRDALDPRLRQA